MLNRKKVKVGDHIEITDNSDDNFGGRFYVVDLCKHVFWYSKKTDSDITDWNIGFYYDYFFNIVVANPNREYLRDFIKLNNINVSAVSKYLGHTRSWLATMYLNRKYDITDETLKSIIKQLHIDWASNEFIHVKKTKQHTAYRIKPASCLSEKSRIALQETMWKGLTIKA